MLKIGANKFCLELFSTEIVWMRCGSVSFLFCRAFIKGPHRWYVYDCDGTIEVGMGPLFLSCTWRQRREWPLSA